MKVSPAYVLAIAATISAMSLPQPNTFKGFGRYATFTDAASGFTFDLHSNNYFGPPFAVTVNSSESHSRSRFSPSANTGTGLVLLEERDICNRLALCASEAADAAVTASLFIANTVGGTCSAIGASIWHYFSDNNYANLNAVLQGAVVGLVVNIVSTPIGNAMLNTNHGVTDGGDNNDACNVLQKNVMANDFGGAIEEFCLSIQAAKSTDNTETHYYAGDVSQNDPSTESGFMSVSKAFVAAQAGNWGPTCSALGITWKRWLDLSW